MEEQVGLLIPQERSYDARLAALLSMPSTPLTFEQVLHILEAGVETVTPVGTASPYTYTYNWPTAAALNTIKTYTIEAGNAVVTGDVREMEYCFVESFTLSGQQGESWMMSANWRGRQVAESSFTGSLSLPSVEEALFSKTTLFLDASGGTIGTTQETGVLVAFSMDVETGIVPVWVGDGQLYFVSHKFIAPSITFTMTLELENTDNTVKEERDAYEADNVRLIQLTCPGTSSRQMDIKLAAKYDSVGSYQNSDGNTTVQLEGHVVYSSADTLFGEIVIANMLSAVQ